MITCIACPDRARSDGGRLRRGDCAEFQSVKVAGGRGAAAVLNQDRPVVGILDVVVGESDLVGDPLAAGIHQESTHDVLELAIGDADVLAGAHRFHTGGIDVGPFSWADRGAQHRAIGCSGSGK